MDLNIGFMEMLRLGAKLFNHKLIQFRLGTNETKVVRTDYGDVKGCKRKTLYDEGTYFAFEGIPYAKPPLGDLRFRAPQPPEPWKGIKDCTQCRNKPMQKHFVLHRIEGSEDCLYLNVYAKTLSSDKPLPVMVWIYGGGFQIGEATRDIYAPDYFMKEDVILVTFNYRLGALGFLSLQDPDIGVPGNAGLKDQVMALRWIKQNISHFNGDPNNITLFGESAGGASTHFMMITDKTKGLFHKAIMQSGSALCPWAQGHKNEWGYRLARSIGYKGSNNDKEVFRYLMKVDPHKIVSHDNSLLTVEEKNNQMIIAFGPVVEPYVSEDCILPKPQRELLRNAWSNDIPLMIGSTSSEGLFSYQKTQMDPTALNALGDCISVLPPELKRQFNEMELREKGLILRKAYFGDKQPSLENTLWPYLDLLAHYNFWHAIQRTIYARRDYASNSPTYLYRFDLDSPDFNHYRILSCGRSVRGVSHADDLSYLFYHISSWKLNKATLEYNTIERMIGMWTAFAKFSNPNCKEIEPTTWEPIESVDGPLKCLNIGEEVTFIDLPENNKLQVWNSLYTKDNLY